MAAPRLRKENVKATSSLHIYIEEETLMQTKASVACVIIFII